MVRFLTREEEADIAKRIARGQVRALKALSRSPIAIRQIIAIREDLNLGVRSIKEIVVFDEDEVTEEMLQNRAKDVTTDRKSTRLNSSHQIISYAVFCLKKKKKI